MHRHKLFSRGLAGLAMLGSTILGSSVAATASSPAARTAHAAGPPIIVASPECAHCLAMALLPSQMKGLNVQFQTWGTLTDLTAGLASGKIDIGQIDYTGLVSFISKGLPIVAISGEVNGGSDFVLAPSIKIAPNNWKAFKALVMKDKAAGHLFTIASNFGTVQDIELRLELPRYGINPNTDVNMVNVPYQGMAQALHAGSVQAAIPVQPVAAQITLGHYGKHFAYPYNQAAGSLTNVVVVTKSYLASHPTQVAEVAKGMTSLVPYLRTAAGKAAWAKAVEKYTNIGSKVVKTALAQLTPDINMSFSQITAIAKAMYTQHLISSPLSAKTLRSHVDYAPLAKAAGKSPKSFGAGS